MLTVLQSPAPVHTTTAPHPGYCDCALCEDAHAAALARSLGLDDEDPGEPPTDADRAWLAAQHDDGEGLTEREVERCGLAPYTVSALDRFLGDLDDRAEEAAAQDLYQAGLLPV
jgi:hypothetical protein